MQQVNIQRCTVTIGHADFFALAVWICLHNNHKLQCMCVPELALSLLKIDFKIRLLPFFFSYLAYLNKLRNTAKDLDNGNDGK